jgi:hypothetical protein
MAISNEELLRKATLTTTDFGGAGEAPLSVEQVKQFIKLTAANQVFLPDVRTVTAGGAKWEESIVDFGGRITRGGTEATRLEAADRAKPTTGNVEISTVLLRAEVPVSDEAMEDNVAEEGFANDLESLIADQFGFDVEELMVNGDKESGDAYLKLLDGWLKQAEGGTGHVTNAASDGQDYQTIFKKLLMSVPNRFKRNLTTEGRYYVPVALEELYRDILSNRGTPLGDLRLEGTGDLKYQGILIKGAPSLAVKAGSPDTSKILLTHRQNLYAGWRRRMTIETFRDPREGATSFIVTARVDAKIAVPAATAIATNVNVEPS